MNSLPQEPKAIAGLVLRLTFGLGILLVGLVHYQGISGFTGMVSQGLGPLSGLGTLWAYILPGLMVVGGALIVLRKYCHIATWCVTVALGSIVVGMLLKPVLSGNPAMLGEVMPAVNNAFIWLIFYGVMKKFSCCDS